jgi:hypothetical protein
VGAIVVLAVTGILGVIDGDWKSVGFVALGLAMAAVVLAVGRQAGPQR